ncbi:MAG TPA: hypothetical protein VM536_03905 [Chloroflexia bacterium]|nr:hypothetical protein [Chloroflexia bacterium]
MADWARPRPGRRRGLPSWLPIVVLGVLLVAACPGVLIGAAVIWPPQPIPPLVTATPFFMPPPVLTAPASSADILLADVYESPLRQNEWFQLFNRDTRTAQLTGWMVCTSGECVPLPLTIIGPSALARVQVSTLAGWPAGGLDSTADLVALLDASHTPVDSVNWGPVDPNWKSYPVFQALLWAPGLTPPGPGGGQSFYRMALGANAHASADWTAVVNTTGGPAGRATLPPAPATLVAGPLATGVVPLGTPPGPAHVVELTDVYDAPDPAGEWFQLYNMTDTSLTLTGWTVCTSSSCVVLPALHIAPHSLAKVWANSLPGWPPLGLNGAGDMVVVADPGRSQVDAMNWGPLDPAWPNLGPYRPVLWDAGIPRPHPGGVQSFSRSAVGVDTDRPGDWVVTAP